MTEIAKGDLLKYLKGYKPFDDDEKIELEGFIDFLENNKNVYSRENPVGCITSSCWIINKDKNKVLLIHHKIYNCWAPLGGHADNETDLPYVAIKEAQEESGIKNIKFLNKEILDIAILPVAEHEKYGKIVPPHLHFDVRYLLEADDSEELIIAEREVSDVKWFDVDEVQNLNIDIMPVIKRVMKKI